MSPTSRILLMLVPLVVGGTAAAAQSPPERPDGVPFVTAAGDGFALALDTSGTGWAILDIRIVRPTTLHLHVTHDTIDNLCLFTNQGEGLYDNGHHTAIHLWSQNAGSPFSGRFLTWFGSPHRALPILQTGACGDLDPIHLPAGDTARLVIATSVPGYNVTLLGDTADAAERHHALPLVDHPEHVYAQPQAQAALDERVATSAVALQRAWHHEHDGGPAALYGIPWMHARSDGLPAGFVQDAAVRSWGFTGADWSGDAPPAPEQRGGVATRYDWVTVFPGWTQGGRVDGHVHEEALAGVATGTYEAGATFLTVPLAPSE